MTPANTLDALTRWLAAYVVFPNEHYAPTLALWAAHTWASPSFYTTPRIILSSPVPGSGKTRVLELLEGICHAHIMTVNSSTAALYRRIAQSSGDGKTPPTVLYDEVDALFGKRPTPQSEEVRALLNAGYKAGATVDRCEGDAASMNVIRFPVFAPAALAGLAGNMPATITTRAITMEIKKRRSGEQITPYRERDARAEIAATRDELAAWIASIAAELAAARPVMPVGVEDRAAEVWEPLLAVADAAGDHWPTTARAACRAFVFAPERRPVSLGVELLHDIREVMNGRDKIPTVDLLRGLHGMDESAWRELDGGRGLTARRMAQLLSGYAVKSITIREGAAKPYKGYATYPTAKQAGLADAWARYLAPLDADADHIDGNPNPPHLQKSVTSVTPVTPQVDRTKTVTAPATAPVTETVTGYAAVTEKHPVTSGVTDVTQVTDFPNRTGGPSAPNATDTDLDRRLVKFLSDLPPDEHMSAHIIGQCMNEHPPTTVARRLDALATAGHITRTERGYGRPERSTP